MNETGIPARVSRKRVRGENTRGNVCPTFLFEGTRVALTRTQLVARLLGLSMQRRKQLAKQALACTLLATLAAYSGGCGEIHNPKPVPRLVVKDAALPQLLESYNRMAKGINTLSATVVLKPTTGSAYSGVIDEYHEVKAFLLAARPAEIRVIGQAPVIGKTIFDMASDGETFRVSIPSKQKFLVGAVALERASKKPIENLRPHHLLDSLLWPEIGQNEKVLLEEFNDERGRYYVLTVVRGADSPEIARKIWFNRADLQVSRLESYGPGGILVSDVRVAEWQPLVSDQEGTAATWNGVTSFPRKIKIERPHDDYTLDLGITKLVLNGTIPAERFKLEQPAGAELVRVGENVADKQP